MIFKRIRDLTVATIHEGLDQIEDPITMLNQYLRDMEKEIRAAEEAITKQLAIKANFQKQKEDSEQVMIKRGQQAELALRAGEEELAKKALLSKKSYQEKVDYYSEICSQNDEKIKGLKEQLYVMKEKYQEMKDKKVVLVARANAAKTKEAMDVVITSFNDERAATGFQRMEEKIIEMETRADILSKRSGNSSFESLQRLENSQLIEEEFNQLKEKIQTSTTA